MLQKRAARAVDDTFGHSGRAGGIHNVERMVERKLLKLDLARFRRQELFKENRIGEDRRLGSAEGFCPRLVRWECPELFDLQSIANVECIEIAIHARDQQQPARNGRRAQHR